jgi:segregation and condensation protein B
MEDLKNKIEALLFSSGRFMSLDEIKRLCRLRDEENLKKTFQDLKIDYDNRNSSLVLINEGDKWKIQTKQDYLPVVKKIITETELSKSLMETLAVIAWKYPIKQCDLIKVRTNKAYEHLKVLEEVGYISRQKHGRTKLIKLTDKFFGYFDLPPEKLKERFSNFDQMANSISSKEDEIKQMKSEQKTLMEQIKKDHEKDEQEQIARLDKEEDEIEMISKAQDGPPLSQETPKEVSESSSAPALDASDNGEIIENNSNEREISSGTEETLSSTEPKTE